MITVSAFPGRYIQGYQAINRIGQDLSRLGSKGLAVLAPSAHKNLLNVLIEKTENQVELVFEQFARECCESEIERFRKIGIDNNCDFVIGVGGGKAIDTSKSVANRMNVPVAVVPTIASTDAPCSAVAVIYNEHGAVDHAEYMRRNPDLVIVDTEIIANAPTRFLVAGMGDALATWFEAESCRQTHSNNELGEKSSMTAYALAKLCYDTLLEYGLAAKMSCDANAVTPALEHIVEANTLLSGLGFESGGLATAHSIHNGLTALPQTHNANHGEKVTIGVLASLYLTDKPRQLIDEVYTFCESVGLPITLSDIGLESATTNELRLAAERACADGEFIHHESGDISPEMVVFALLAANAEGKRRRDQ